MPQNEPETHSFIIKFWLEREVDGEGRVWRGQITHVPGRKEGSRRYLHHLEDITEFIAPFLASALPLADRRARAGWFDWRIWRFWRKE